MTPGDRSGRSSARSRLRRGLIGVVSVLILGEATAQRATADFTYYFDQSNSFQDGNNYGKVVGTVDTAANQVALTVNLTNPYGSGITPLIDSFAFNYTGSANLSYSVSVLINGMWSVSQTWGLAQTVPDDFSGFGKFAKVVEANTAGVGATALQVTMTGDTNLNNFVAPSTGGAEGTPYFAAQISWNGSVLGYTGQDVGATTAELPPTEQVHAPIPSTAVLMAVGCLFLGLGSALRRRSELA